jgi:hypothetical protein
LKKNTINYFIEKRRIFLSGHKSLKSIAKTKGDNSEKSFLEIRQTKVNSTNVKMTMKIEWKILSC